MNFDYVIVGAGSAGCVLANRLSEDPTVSVCLLEAGKSDNSTFIHTPASVLTIMRGIPMAGGQYNWQFKSVPQKGLNGRQSYQPRGKTLGGSSSINAMIYIRGHQSDYDDWAAAGNNGWDFRSVLPYFRRSEHNERIKDEYHGQGGLLNVAESKSNNPVHDLFIQAAKENGCLLNDDFNGRTQQGVGRYQLTQKDGHRWSTAAAFLAPAKSRPNLTVLTQAHVSKIRLEGKKATGISCRYKGKMITIDAKKEVLLSAGAYQSPQILLLSGIGSEEKLKPHGISLQHQLPGVGENLVDHIDYTLAYKSSDKRTIGISPYASWDVMRSMLQYRRDSSGLLSTNYAESGGFLKTDPNLSRPDIQLHFVAGIVDDHGRKLHMGHGISCHVCVLRPDSVGSVALQSADPFAAPKLDFNFLDADNDIDVLLKGYKMTREIMRGDALAGTTGAEIYTNESMTDDELVHWLRQRADTVYHPVSSCRMGSGELDVVDSELKVHGIENLRVVDASVMPTLIGGNTNAPTIMIAEKASDMIRASY